MSNTPIKPVLKPRIGLYSLGLKAYWPQFPGLKERLAGYGTFLAEEMSSQAEVYNYGFVDDEKSGREAGEYFNAHNVDLIFCHNATYVTSSAVLPVHQACKAPVVVLNLQPAPRADYLNITTGEWLAQCTGCSVPEISNALSRAAISFRVINGLLGLRENPSGVTADEVSAERPEAQRAWREINEYIKAAGVKRTLAQARFGFLGGYYSGMLDMYSDLTMLSAQSGLHIELLEMCDLMTIFKNVTAEESAAKLREISAMFTISEDSPSEPLARKPAPEQLDWASRVAVALEKLVDNYELDALSYYYHSQADSEYEELQAGFIVGMSLLTARGIPCAGEGDIKTNLAMKICDILDIGGSFSEIVIVDYLDGTILMGHDGPFHIKIADDKPVLRGMGLYHGKRGSGVSVEAKVKSGPVTLLGCSQTSYGKLKLIISEGKATNGTIMQIGNTQTPIKFALEPDAYMDRWFKEAPTHHLALSVGHNAALLVKTAELLNIPYVIV